MTSNPETDHQVDLELTFGPGLRCRVLSRNTVSAGAAAHYSAIVLGQLCLDGQAIDAGALCDALLKANGDLQQLYNRLSGRFFVAIADSSQQVLHLFPDFMGIQTCYHSLCGKELLVSDSMALLKSLPETNFTLSDQSLFDYFYFHCIPSPATIYSQCQKTAPGTLLTFSDRTEPREQVLYRPPFARQADDIEQLQRECLQVIEQAVQISAGENCGAFLSGGLDSSTVAGMLARGEDTARTFSIGFESPDYDETPYAKITAEHFGTQHQVLYLDANSAADELVDIARYFDEPFGNSSAMAAYFCARFAKENGIHTLLAGDGGDELFAGNGHYAKQKQFEVFHQLPGWLQGSLRMGLGNSLTSRLPLLSKGASYVRQADIPLPDRMDTYNFVQLYGPGRMFDPDFLARVDAHAPVAARRRRYRDCRSDDPVDRMLYLDWKFTLADNDLVKVKTMCAKAGVDVRFPLLDRQVVDFSCRVPAGDKLPGFTLRDFYKNACRGFLPDDTLSKSKHGFGLPFGLWMKDDMRLQTLSRDCIESFRRRDILSSDLIDDTLKSHEQVHAGYYGELIWIIVILELWLQQESP